LTGHGVNLHTWSYRLKQGTTTRKSAVFTGFDRGKLN